MDEIRQFLEGQGYRLREINSEYWTTVAHFRRGQRDTSLNIRKLDGFWRDWVTGAAGSFKDLVTLITGNGELSDAKLKELLEKIENQPTPAEKIKVTKKFDKDVLLTLLPDYRFFAQRFISEDTQKLFQIGLCSSGKLRNRYVIPIFCHKTRNLIGMSGRDYRDSPPKEVIKWKHESKSSEFIFPAYLNDSIIREKKEAVLVESPGDCLALWEMGRKNTIVCFGCRASSKIINYISGIYGLKKIWISFNDDRGVNDELAGNTGAQKLKKKLSKLFDESKIEIAFPPNGCNDWSAFWTKKNQAAQEIV